MDDPTRALRVSPMRGVIQSRQPAVNVHHSRGTGLVCGVPAVRISRDYAALARLGSYNIPQHYGPQRLRTVAYLLTARVGLGERHRERGPAWKTLEREVGSSGSDANPLEATMGGPVGWEAHAQFMEDLVESDVVLMGGPVTGTGRSHTIRADSQTAVHIRLEQDSWTSSGLSRTTASYHWQMLLGGPLSNPSAAPRPAHTGVRAQQDPSASDSGSRTWSLTPAEKLGYDARV